MLLDAVGFAFSKSSVSRTALQESMMVGMIFVEVSEGALFCGL